MIKPPPQKQLDELSGRFLNNGNEVPVEEAHAQIIILLKKEGASMGTYGKILSKMSGGLKSAQPMSCEFLDKIISVTATAIRTSLVSQKQIVSSIIAKSGELQKVKTQLEEYKRPADTEPLTQLYNRRAFDRALCAIYDSSRNVAYGSMILIDIDHFKVINDRFSHPAGDRITQVITGLIQTTAKQDLFVAGSGGEEFAIVVEGHGENAVFCIAEEIRQAILNTSFINVAEAANYGPITMSVGLCTATHAQSREDLYAKANRALHASKTSGRNRTTRFSSLADNNFLKNWLPYHKK